MNEFYMHYLHATPAVSLFRCDLRGDGVRASFHSPKHTRAVCSAPSVAFLALDGEHLGHPSARSVTAVLCGAITCIEEHGMQ
jgi:hypothetical protein